MPFFVPLRRLVVLAFRLIALVLRLIAFFRFLGLESFLYSRLIFVDDQPFPLCLLRNLSQAVFFTELRLRFRFTRSAFFLNRNRSLLSLVFLVFLRRLRTGVLLGLLLRLIISSENANGTLRPFLPFEEPESSRDI